MTNYALTALFVLIGFSAEGFCFDDTKVILIAQTDEGDSQDKKKHKGPPPQQAIEACQSQSVGYSCEFMSHNGDVIQGVCEIIPGDIIACLPDNRPPHHHKDKHHSQPPDEELDN